MPLTLLFLATNPTDTARQRVDQECHAIDAALRGAEYRDRFKLVSHDDWIEDFQELILRHRPAILHFGWQSIPCDQIALEDSADMLETTGRWFTVMPDDLRCVVLNACASHYQARAVAEYIDCVIRMPQALSDTSALTFSTAFYQSLAYGRDLKTAFDLACLALRAQNAGDPSIPRLIALRADPTQIVLTAGETSVFPLPALANGRTPCRAPVGETGEGQGEGLPLPPIDLFALSTPRNERFLGRQAELDTLQRHLIGEPRAKLVTICAAPGQGKTTLARRAAERFASAFPGGVLAISLENLPSRLDLVAQIATFFNLDTNQNPPQLERQVVHALEHRASLLLLDNAETLTHALQRDDPTAADLNDFLQNQLPPTVTLLVTSCTRFTLGGAHEFTLDLHGLAPADGARLFQQRAPDCRTPLDPAQLAALSIQLKGHPLSLHLLGTAFNDAGLDLPAFLERFEAHLSAAKKHTKQPTQPTLFACIAANIQTLEPELKTLFCYLALFHNPFTASRAAAIFDPDAKASSIPAQLYHLWQRGLLELQLHPICLTQFELYQLLPHLRRYAEQIAPLPPEILPRFAQVYEKLIYWIFEEINEDPTAALVARLSARDIERALEYLQEDLSRAYYNRALGYVEFCLGHPWKGKPHLEQALAWARNHNPQLVYHILYLLGLICGSIDQPQEALRYYREELTILQAMGDRSGQANTLYNMAMLLLNDPAQAIPLLRRLIDLLKTNGMTQDASGHTLAQHEALLAELEDTPDVRS